MHAGDSRMDSRNAYQNRTGNDEPARVTGLRSDSLFIDKTQPGRISDDRYYDYRIRLLGNTIGMGDSILSPSVRPNSRRAARVAK